MENMKIKIFITDDQAVIRDVIKDIIERQTEEIAVVGEAPNGKIMLDKCKKTTVDVYIIDVSMPVMNGLQAAKEIRKTNKAIPIIALTAGAMPHEVERTSIYGMNACLTKPLDMEKLKETIIRWIL